jgi:hypothetical protein
MPIINSEVRSSQLKIACGMYTTVAADDLVSTGLQKVLYAVAQLEDTPVAATALANAFIGNQAGVPPAGSIRIRTWNSTIVAAATTFSKRVSWVAIGY